MAANSSSNMALNFCSFGKRENWSEQLKHGLMGDGGTPLLPVDLSCVRLFSSAEPPDTAPAGLAVSPELNMKPNALSSGINRRVLLSTLGVGFSTADTTGSGQDATATANINGCITARLRIGPKSLSLSKWHRG